MLTGDMLVRSARRFPQKPAIICGRAQLCYAGLNARANQLAHALRALGLGPSAKIGIVSRNRIEYGIAFFGVAKSGHVLVNVSVLYAPDELCFVLAKADVEVLIFEDCFAEKIAGVRPQLAAIKTFIVIGDDAGADDGVPFNSFIEDHPKREPEFRPGEDDAFCMTYTGGTTGRPKGVLMSHRARAVTAHTVMVEEALDENDVVGIVTPMFHVAALNIMFQPAILAGATTTLLTSWSVPGFAEMVRRDKMTAAFMVPAQANMLVNDDGFDAGDFATWRKLSFAGAPMPDPVQRQLMELLPSLRLTQIYGQSEMGVIAVLRHWYLPDKLGAVGRQPYNVDVAVVDNAGKQVAPGEIGEVASWGANLMLEYYNEPEQTRQFFRLGDGRGWSGDLAVIDDDGFITLVDRSKDMIISGGENIYPSEIERVLYDHPAVSECAVFGIPHGKWGEVPAAYVTLKPGAAATGDELEAHCAHHLARFKRPRLIRFVDSFPKTAIGKIQKNLLKEEFWRERGKKI